MNKPISVTTKVEPAEAMQFLGWRNAWDIAQWARVFCVPQGAENPFRTENEMDRSNGHVKDEAPPFLILQTGRGEFARVDVGDWVIQDSMGPAKAVKGRSFDVMYDKQED